MNCTHSQCRQAWICPPYDALGRSDLRISTATDVPDDDREFLRKRSHELRERLAELRFESSRSPVHGDAHAQNLHSGGPSGSTDRVGGDSVTAPKTVREHLAMAPAGVPGSQGADPVPLAPGRTWTGVWWQMSDRSWLSTAVTANPARRR